MNCAECKTPITVLNALDCDKCGKSFCTECIDEHKCGASEGGPAKKIALAPPKPLTSPIAPKALSDQFLALGSEKWREYIDLDLHHLGKTAIDQGQGPEGQREAFSENMDRGVAFATKFLGQPLTLEFYVGLFQYCAGHLEGKGERRYRQSDERITLGTTVKMTDDAVRELAGQSGAMRGVNGLDRSHKGDLISMNFPTFMPDLINGLFGEFHLELGASDDPETRLLAIARLIQNLERLHPFRNANGRTNVLLMNKLLTEWGFHPAILDDPNESPFLSALEWRDKVRKGMFRWAIFCANVGKKSLAKLGATFSFSSPTRARQAVRIDGREVNVGTAAGSQLECLFDSVRQGLPHGHAQGGLSAVELRDWLVGQYRQQPGAVALAHVRELERGGMGNLTDDVPALAARLGVRIRIYERGSSGDTWLEFDSAGGPALHVINILHQGIHFVPIGLPGAPAHDAPALPTVPSSAGPSPLPLVPSGVGPSSLPIVPPSVGPSPLPSALSGVGYSAAQDSPRGAPRSEARPTGGPPRDDRPTASSRFGGPGSASRRDEHQRSVSRVASPIRRDRQRDADRHPRRSHDERCHFCRHSARDGRRVHCASRSCEVWRLACEDCYRDQRNWYRCPEHRH